MKFKVVSGDATQSASGDLDPRAQIQRLVAENKVFLFMKGTPEQPQCGFSYKVVDILNAWGVPFKAFNVLADPAVREEVKRFSNWPTIPQLYVNQEFVGGCDIVTELSETGEFLEVLQNALPEHKFTPPEPPAPVQPIAPATAAEMLKKDPAARLLDVRSPEEWDIAHVGGATLLNQENVEEILDTWDPATPMLLICHHGQRSFDAGRFFTQHGFKNVYNVQGGIDAWSQTVDPNLRRY